MKYLLFIVALMHQIQTFADSEDHRVWGYSNNGNPLERSKIEGIKDFDIALKKAHEKTTGDEELIIAIIDSGLLLDHFEFKNRLWTNLAEKNGKPGVDDDQNGYIDDIHGWDWVQNDNIPNDQNGHGTHIAGIIGAENNQKGISGINHQSKIMVLKFLDAGLGGNISNAIDALHYAIDHGAKVINCSWVDEVDELGEGDPEREPDPRLVEVIKKAKENDVLIIAAAGNDGFDLSTTKNYPASFSQEFSNVISVGAVQNRGELWDITAFKSNYGINHVDLVAPGEDVVSYYKDGKLRPLSGTSMAAPFVTGVASLVRSYFPEKSASDVKKTILKSVTTTPYLRRFFITGGMVNANYALEDKSQPNDPNDPYNFPFKKDLNKVEKVKGIGETLFHYKVENASEIALFINRYRTMFANKIEIYDKNKTLVQTYKGQDVNFYTPTIKGNELFIKVINEDENYVTYLNIDHIAYRID